MEELLTCDGHVRGRNEILREERGEEKRRGEEQGSQLGAFQFPSLEYRYRCSGNLTCKQRRELPESKLSWVIESAVVLCWSCTYRSLSPWI
jgi:hypothetical protein